MVKEFISQLEEYLEKSYYIYFIESNIDSETAISKIEKIPDKEKQNDGSDKDLAIVMETYICKYFKAFEKNVQTNMIIALIQQAASFYFADKQHYVAK